MAIHDESNLEHEDSDGVLGLEHQSVRLHDPDSRWEALYRQEEGRLRGALDVLGDILVDIQHFGSTSIPGIKAKPILDILVGIRPFDAAPMCIAPLESAGYDYAPQAGIPGDFTFGKGERRTHLVHVVAYGGPNWTQNLRFRDTLRRDPALAREYEALKIRLSQEHARDRAAYTSAKTRFIQEANKASDAA